MPQFLKHQRMPRLCQFGTVFDRTEIHLDSQLSRPLLRHGPQGAVDSFLRRKSAAVRNGKEVQIIIQPHPSVRIPEDTAFAAPVPAAQIDSRHAIQMQCGNIPPDPRQRPVQQFFRRRISDPGIMKCFPLVRPHCPNPLRSMLLQVSRKTMTGVM